MEATAKPTATPIAPPPVHKATASITNWVRMSRGLAPIASLSPISRVRSVTDTSMMFMMPIPPTISETQATAASSAETVRVDASCAATMEAAVATLKSLVFIMYDMVALLHESVDIPRWPRRVAPLGHRTRQDVANRIAIPVGAADQPVLGGCYRNEGDVILAIAAGSALFSKHADDLSGAPMMRTTCQRDQPPRTALRATRLPSTTTCPALRSSSSVK